MIGRSGSRRQNATTGDFISRDDLDNLGLGSLAKKLTVKDYGAVGDGVTDDILAFQAAHDALSVTGSSVGGEIRIPAGNYYLSDTWKISKRVTILGTNAGDQPTSAASRLRFPADKTGIRFYSITDSPTGSGADRSRLESVNLTATSKVASGNGIECTTVVKIDHCIVRSFKGHGIYIHGQTGVGATGIADAWSVKNTRILTNGGDGLHVNGNDSNVGVAEMVECTSNDGWGYYDNASFCNTYIACEAAGNTLGDFYNRQSTGLGGVYLGCYVEQGGLCDFDGAVLVIGGVMNFTTGNSIIPASAGLMLSTHANRPLVFGRAGLEIGRIDTLNKLTGLAGAKWGNSVSDYTDNDPGITKFVTSVAGAQDRMRFTNPNGQVGSVTTSGSATAYNTSSDVRLKENIIDAPSAGADIDAVRIVSFQWKNSGEHQRYGVIAQELVEVFPDAVTAGDSGEEISDTWGVDYSKLIPVLVKEMQELRARVQALEGGA